MLKKGKDNLPFFLIALSAVCSLVSAIHFLFLLLNHAHQSSSSRRERKRERERERRERERERDRETDKEEGKNRMVLPESAQVFLLLEELRVLLKEN
jgi:hypothetical protein